MFMGDQSVELNWLHLPEVIWRGIFYRVSYKDRANLDLTCKLFYKLTPYDDLEVELDDQENPEASWEFFAALKTKCQGHKRVNFRRLSLTDCQEDVLEIVNSYSVAELTLTFSIHLDDFPAAMRFFRVIQGGFTNVVQITLESASLFQLTKQGFSFGDMNTAFLVNLPNLKSVELDDVDWLPDVFHGTLENIRLRFERPVLTKGQLDAMLAPCVNLESLAIVFSEYDYDNEHMNFLPIISYELPLLPKLKSLDFLAMDNNFGDRKGTKVAELLKRGGLACPLLESLYLDDCKFTEWKIPEFRQLKHLEINGCFGRIDSFLSNTCPTSMVRLDLDCNFSDHTIALIAERFTTLKTFVVRCINWGFLGTTLRELFDSCTQLERVSMNMSNVHERFSLAGIAYASKTVKEFHIVTDENHERVLTELLQECEQLKMTKDRSNFQRATPLNIHLGHAKVSANLENLASTLAAHSFNVHFYSQFVRKALFELQDSDDEDNV